ncbi:helix-turn-helix domain-containing protein [Cellulosimicrobium marinum]|nr:helix-turn-helix domain-containing protein [Cellulosimicrobium marinum]
MTDGWTAPRNPRDLGTYLARVRRTRGLTQAQVADELGITRQYLSELENGVENLWVQRLFELLDTLDVDLRLHDRR